MLPRSVNSCYFFSARLGQIQDTLFVSFKEVKSLELELTNPQISDEITEFDEYHDLCQEMVLFFLVQGFLDTSSICFYQVFRCNFSAESISADR